MFVDSPLPSLSRPVGPNLPSNGGLPTLNEVGIASFENHRFGELSMIGE
jgi:hypothetical protein